MSEIAITIVYQSRHSAHMTEVFGSAGSSPGPGDSTVGLAPGLLLGEGMPLVVRLLAPSQRQLHLRVTVGEVQRQRHQGEALLPGLADQPADLVAPHQQLARPSWLVVGPGALVVLGDVDVTQPDLAVAYLGEPVDERGAPGPQRLHLGAGQYQSGLEGRLDVVVVACLAVLRHELATSLPCHGHQDLIRSAIYR